MSKLNKEKDSKNSKTHKRTNSNSMNAGNTSSNLSGLNMTINNNQNEILSATTTSNQIPGLVIGNVNYNQNVNVNQIPIQINTTLSNQQVNDSNKIQSSEEFKNFSQKVDCVGKSPSARFGHTVVMVSPVKIILFGGAVGDTRNFQFTNETYVLNMITKIWMKLEGNN